MRPEDPVTSRVFIASLGVARSTGPAARGPLKRGESGAAYRLSVIGGRQNRKLEIRYIRPDSPSQPRDLSEKYRAATLLELLCEFRESGLQVRHLFAQGGDLGFQRLDPGIVPGWTRGLRRFVGGRLPAALRLSGEELQERWEAAFVPLESLV